ncbi:glycosyl hydrolase family 8 [Herbiconiux sp. CPCC 203407]|uniref:Glycosyl hydrolase family 8 n=1 Tax=Herbiconiux oxytropis TaxID=2970915 RepID=A0AA41XAN9_9MICO|nr:glycosyl hydrolase family 8 [Herbiconiux oxytropis]MCS5721112.1 glycosyl hydrolase family 8 [Herbiconiux oxytropis]MCS5724764.1 glycosyl hydrolase family 8 [Herbiconiux oxytropis]
MKAATFLRAAAIAAACTLLLGASAMEPEAAAAGAARPFGTHPVVHPAGAAAAPGGVAAADAATAAAYDRWKAAYVRAGCGTGSYYVDASSSTAPGTRVVSEGQGYGMVITALMAGHDPQARTVFDGLFRYADAHPSATDPDLMAWNQSTSCASIPGNDSSATDGDLDIAFGLLLADTQWGSAGTIDYAGEALRIIAALKRSAINPQTFLPELGDWVSAESGYLYGTRTSDLMVDHFTAFENATGDVFWGQVARASSALVAELQETASPGTGLLPDFAVNTDTVPAPAPPGYLESPYDGDHNWNAVRTPWRLASSALLVGDAASRAATGRVSSWIIEATGGRPDRVRAGYELDGTPLQTYGDLAFTAQFGAGAMPDARRQGWVDAVWTAIRTAPAAGYYSDSLALQSMLLMSNNSWLPALEAPSGVQRIGGENRYAVSAAVSASTFAPGVATVYLASGAVFPDALSASAAAGAEGSPVLLTPRDAIPAHVSAELSRLAPDRIIVLGGPATVSEAVVSSLAPTGAEVVRIGGADRYAVSAAVSSRTFDDASPRVAYAASGQVFPDALSGSAAAGADGAPVLLVARDSVPAPIATELGRLDADSVLVLGGSNTVSASTFAALDRTAPATRVGGTDRYAVAAAVSARTFEPSRVRTVYVASGAVFPDALSASATAVANHAPVLLVTRDSVPAATAAELRRLAPSRIVVLGGTATVSDAVASSLAAFLAR